MDTNFVTKGFKVLEVHEARKMNILIKKLTKISESVGFCPVFLPTVAKDQVFSQQLGEMSEIVYKQMFCLANKNLVLRPEMTAIVCKHFAAKQRPQRLYSYGSNFRNERPQKGRLREFYQFNLEILLENSQESIFDLLYVPLTLFKSFDINVAFEFNYLPDKKYSDILKQHFQKHKQKLSLISQDRLQRGAILRILDSKEIQDQEIIKQAPIAQISEEKKTLLKQIIDYVKSFGINASINPRLVRGLDYYHGIVFEMIDKNHYQRRQNALGGGGGYLIGKHKKPAIGLALGLNRILDYVALNTTPKKIAVLSKNPIKYRPDHLCIYRFNSNLCKGLKLAHKYECVVAIFTDNGTNKWIKKDLKTGEQNKYNDLKDSLISIK